MVNIGGIYYEENMIAKAFGTSNGEYFVDFYNQTRLEITETEFNQLSWLKQFGATKYDPKSIVKASKVDKYIEFESGVRKYIADTDMENLAAVTADFVEINDCLYAKSFVAKAYTAFYAYFIELKSGTVIKIDKGSYRAITGWLQTDTEYTFPDTPELIDIDGADMTFTSTYRGEGESATETEYEAITVKTGAEAGIWYGTDNAYNPDSDTAWDNPDAKIITIETLPTDKELINWLCRVLEEVV